MKAINWINLIAKEFKCSKKLAEDMYKCMITEYKYSKNKTYKDNYDEYDNYMKELERKKYGRSL